MLEIILKRL